MEQKACAHHLAIHHHIEADAVGLDEGTEVDICCILIVLGKPKRQKTASLLELGIQMLAY